MNKGSVLSEIKFYSNLVLSPISIFLNIVLLYLIAYKSVNNLTNFKKVLYFGCINDLLFGICNFLILPDLTVIKGIYYLFTRGALGYLPFPFSMWTFPITLFFIYSSFVNVVVQFVYRYLLTCWKIMLNPFQFLCLALIGACVFVWYPIDFYVHLFTRIHSDAYYSSNLYGTEWEINGKIPSFGAFPVTEFVTAFFVIILLIVAGYILVIFCGIKIWLGIKNNEYTINNPINKYQKQISIVMTVEACIPIITLVLPIFLDLTPMLTGIVIPWGGKLTMLLCCFVPILNPIVKLLVISCYRRWVIKMLCITRNFQISTVPSIHQTSGNNPSKTLMAH